MRILIVDDELITRDWLSLTVPALGAGDLVCGAARDGREALVLADALRPDAIITDVKMPVMDGIAFVQALRERGDATPVVMLSSYSEFEYVRAALRNNALEYILKPEVDAELLRQVLDRVRAQLAPREPASDAAHCGSTVRACCEYIMAHFAEPIALADAAGRAYMNKNYFSELFKKETGMNFVKFLNRVRIAHAAALLMDRETSVTQAAVQSGYTSVSHFDKVFKKMAGISPAAFQKLNKSQKAEILVSIRINI